jgi:RecG-like helicase
MKRIKIMGLVLLGLLIVGLGIALYLFNMPHRNVVGSNADFYLTTSTIVHEYLENPTAANAKYLNEEGESKILAVTGTVQSIDEDMNQQKVILLMEANDKAGVSCTFTQNTNKHADNIKIGQQITVKGVIRSGASYDADMELYEDVILEKCDIIKE